MKKKLESLSESNSLLNRKSYVPLYRQIKSNLINEIIGWNDFNQKFYSDDELCDRFKVSRMTVRQAIKELANEGYLTRERGIGTFLNKGKVLERPVTRLDERLSFDGSPFELIVKCFEYIFPPAPVAAELGIKFNTTTLRIVRVRRARGIPVSLDERWIPEKFTKGLEQSIASTDSLVRWLGARYQLTEIDMKFEGAMVTKHTSEQLDISEGQPVLIRYMTYKDNLGVARMTGQSVHRSDVMRYSVNVPIER